MRELGEYKFLIKHFLKHVINFVQSNDIECQFCGDQSNEILLLLYYHDCLNRAMAVMVTVLIVK